MQIPERHGRSQVGDTAGVNAAAVYYWGLCHVGYRRVIATYKKNYNKYTVINWFS